MRVTQVRFLFVDHISRRTEDEVHGSVRFGALAPLRYARLGGAAVVAPGAISEAIGQLASWLCLERNQFTARPVFLFANAITVAREVPAGSTVELSAIVTKMEEETFVFSGEARFGGEVIQTIQNCNGYFMPLGELEDPDATRRRFDAMVDGGISQHDDEGAAFPFDSLLETVEQTEDSIVCRTTFDPGLTFYRDHFPRFPVTPIVILNETIGAAAQRLLSPRQGQLLRVKRTKDIKIRAFVKPGDTVEAHIKVASRDGATISTVTDLMKDGKRIMRGLYDYHLTEQA